VLAGRPYITPLVAAEGPARTPGECGRLTPRQREVLQLVAEGRSAKEIAGTLRTTAQLTRYAVTHGLVALSPPGGAWPIRAGGRQGAPEPHSSAGFP